MNVNISHVRDISSSCVSSITWPRPLLFSASLPAPLHWPPYLRHFSDQNWSHDIGLLELLHTLLAVLLGRCARPGCRVDSCKTTHVESPIAFLSHICSAAVRCIKTNSLRSYLYVATASHYYRRILCVKTRKMSPPPKTFGTRDIMFSDVSVCEWVCASQEPCEQHISKTNE